MNQLPEDDGSHTSGIQPARSSPTTKKRAPTTTDECYPHLTKKQKVIFVHKANAATGSFPPAFAPAPTPKPPSESANPYKARQPLTVQEMLDITGCFSESELFSSQYQYQDDIDALEEEANSEENDVHNITLDNFLKTPNPTKQMIIPSKPPPPLLMQVKIKETIPPIQLEKRQHTAIIPP